MKRLITITKQFLQKNKDEGHLGVGISTRSLNPNPLLKKYSYWVYHYEMPYESAEEVFYKDEYRLSLYDYLELRDYLHSHKIPYAIVSVSQCRLGTKIWDYKKLEKKYPDIKFAVSYDDDSDKVCVNLNGHK